MRAVQLGGKSLPRPSFPGVGHQGPPLSVVGRVIAVFLFTVQTLPFASACTHFKKNFRIHLSHGSQHPHPPFTQPCKGPILPNPGSSHLNNATALLPHPAPSFLLPLCPMIPPGAQSVVIAATTCSLRRLKSAQASSGLPHPHPDFHPLLFSWEEQSGLSSSPLAVSAGGLRPETLFYASESGISLEYKASGLIF